MNETICHYCSDTLITKAVKTCLCSSVGRAADRQSDDPGSSHALSSGLAKRRLLFVKVQQPAFTGFKQLLLALTRDPLSPSVIMPNRIIIVGCNSSVIVSLLN